MSARSSLFRPSLTASATPKGRAKEVMDRQSDRLPRQTRCEGMRIKREIQTGASGGGQSIKASGIAQGTVRYVGEPVAVAPTPELKGRSQTGAARRCNATSSILGGCEKGAIWRIPTSPGRGMVRGSHAATPPSSVPQCLHLVAAGSRSSDRHAGQVLVGAGSPNTVSPSRAIAVL